MSRRSLASRALLLLLAGCGAGPEQAHSPAVAVSSAPADPPPPDPEPGPLLEVAIDPTIDCNGGLERVDLALSADGRVFASATSSWAIRIWRVGETLPRLEMAGHGDTVSALTLSRDGALLAAGFRDGAVRLWRTTDGGLVRELAGHERGWSVRALAFSPDGALLASGGDYSQAFVWRVEDGAPVLEREWPVFMEHDEPCPPKKRCYSPELVKRSVIAVGLIEDRLHSFSAAGERERAMLAAATDREEHRFPGEHRAAWLSADGSLIAAIDRHGALRVYGGEDPEPRLEVAPPRDETAELVGAPPDVVASRSAAFALDGAAVAGAGADGLIRVWRLADGAVVARLAKGGGALPLALAASGDGRQLLAGYGDGTAVLWDLGPAAP